MAAGVLGGLSAASAFIPVFGPGVSAGLGGLSGVLTTANGFVIAAQDNAALL